MRRDPRGRLCLHGPSGTGKSAFGAHLARVLQRPLLIKRASDLLNAYVGGSEKNLAAMFRQASTDGALLLLDEADSFLRDRQLSRAGWEITQVNELLTQLESFDGLFVASTNLLETIDMAALRRFDVKIHFDYLRPEQAWTLFRETLRQAGGRLTQPALWKTRLAGLDRLTPSDFVNQMARQRFATARLTPQTLFDGLIVEAALKARGSIKSSIKRSIGFGAEF
nr:ATP-binding protein [Thiocapsa sp.]